MESAEEGELTFPLWVAVRYAAGRAGKHERQYLPFAVVGKAKCTQTVRQVADAYRGRFGIESSYRLLHQGLARTSARERCAVRGVAVRACEAMGHLPSSRLA